MRVALILLALVAILLKPEAGTAVVYSGWGIVPSLLIPVMVPLLFMVLMLDVLMSLLWKSQSEGAERQRYQMIVNVNLIVVIAMLVAWIPFFIALGK